VRKELDMAEVGRRIKAARIAKGFATHADLSEAMGRDERGGRVAWSTISNWERGKSLPKKHMARLALALGVSTDYLTYADDGAEPPRLAEAVAQAGLSPSAAEVIDALAKMEPRKLQELLAAASQARKQESTPPPSYSGVRELETPYVRAVPKKRRTTK
jgi:transcriptional regulator with XRE-family HTH domain